MMKGSTQRAGEREELVACITAYDSFYLTVNFDRYTIDELRALKQNIDAEKVGSK